MAEQEVNIPRERTTVWVLENVIDGHYSPEAYFATETIADEALEVINTYMDRPDKWRVSERAVWFRVHDYVQMQTTHTAKWLRAAMDPEYAEFKRLEAKFKDIWK